MPLTRNFRDTVRARARAQGRLPSAGRCSRRRCKRCCRGETDQGRAALRACVNATVGFDRLGEVIEAALAEKPDAHVADRMAIPPPRTCSASSACCRKKPACT